MGLGARHQFPRAEIAGGARKGADALRGQKARLDRGDDAAGDLILHGKNIAQLTVVLLGPVMAARRRFNELCADAQPLAGPANAAFEHITHAQLARDLPHIDGAVLVDECRVAGDHEQPADAGQAGDQILGHPVGEVLLIGIVAHVVERQHSDGGTVRQRQTPGFFTGSSREPLRQFSNEAVTAAVQRFDIAGPSSIVPEGASKFLDAGHQRRVTHGDLGPHRVEQFLLGNHLAGTGSHEGQ